MKRKKKYHLKKQFLFQIISIIFILSFGCIYLGRMFYYHQESLKPIILSDTLASHLIEEEELHQDNLLVLTNDIYRYVGNVTSNHVRYKGLIWRIVRINEDNSITMVTEDVITYLPYTSSFETYVLGWLNDFDKPYTGIFEKSLESKELLSTKICIDSFSSLEEVGCFQTNKDYKIGLLGVDDYLEASATDSYLNNGTPFWTSNRYNVEEAWVVEKDGLVGHAKDHTKYGIRPTITIPGDIHIVDGDGAPDNPYILEDYSVATLQDAYVGSYLSFNDSLWRIVSKEDDKLKIVSTDCVIDKTGNCLLKPFSKSSNELNTTSEDNILYYLNHEYYENLQNKEWITEGNFYTGSYSLTDNNYQTVFKSSISLQVGLLSLGDPFAYEVPNAMLLTNSPENNMGIYSVSDNHTLYETTITEPLTIRPSLYLKGNLTIVEGNGSYIYPYQLGGIYE